MSKQGNLAKKSDTNSNAPTADARELANQATRTIKELINASITLHKMKELELIYNAVSLEIILKDGYQLLEDILTRALSPQLPQTQKPRKAKGER